MIAWEVLESYGDSVIVILSAEPSMVQWVESLDALLRIQGLRNKKKTGRTLGGLRCSFLPRPLALELDKEVATTCLHHAPSLRFHDRRTNPSRRKARRWRKDKSSQGIKQLLIVEV